MLFRLVGLRRCGFVLILRVVRRRSRLVGVMMLIRCVCRRMVVLLFLFVRRRMWLMRSLSWCVLLDRRLLVRRIRLCREMLYVLCLFRIWIRRRGRLLLMLRTRCRCLLRLLVRLIMLFRRTLCDEVGGYWFDLGGCYV